MGAVILSMVGTGLYKSVSDAANELSEIADTIYPEDALASLYEQRYNKYRKIYPALKNIFKEK